MIVQERDGTFDGCQFPVYDAHGNMVLTIARTGTSETNPAYTSSNRRAFDVWGSVRASADLGNPTNKQRYCANLGHVEDDESGLIYMRARYYEPWTGRFLSEDRARDGVNWYVYANSNPVDYADYSGKAAGWLVALLAVIMAVGGYAICEWTGYILGVVFWQQDDSTISGTEDTSTLLGRLLYAAGFSCIGGALAAILGPATYAMSAGLASKLGLVGLVSFLFGNYMGFLEVTMEFTAYEETRL